MSLYPHTLCMYTHAVPNRKAKTRLHMGWPGGCSTRLLASSNILQLPNPFNLKAFYRLFRHRAITLLQRQLHFNKRSICKQYAATPQFFFFSFFQHSNQSKTRKGPQNNKRFQTRKRRHGRNFQGTKITCIWLQSIKRKHCPSPFANCRGGSSKTRRHDHELVFYFKRLSIALKTKWGPLDANSEKQDPFQVQKSQGSLLKS